MVVSLMRASITIRAAGKADMRPIRKAVVPIAAAAATELRLAPGAPLEMVSMADKPLIEHVVEEAIAAGIEQIVFVTSTHKRVVEDHFDDLKRTPAYAAVSFLSVRQCVPLGLGHAILAAQPAIGDEPFAVLLPDELIRSPKPALAQLMQAYACTGHSMVGVAEVVQSELHRYGIVELAAGLTDVPPGSSDRTAEQPRAPFAALRAVIEKPAPGDAPSRLAIAGRYLLTPQVFGFLKHAGDDDTMFSLSHALGALSTDQTVGVVRIEGERFDCGSRIGLLKATVRFAAEQLRNELARPPAVVIDHRAASGRRRTRLRVAQVDRAVVVPMPDSAYTRERSQPVQAAHDLLKAD